jgi:signal transduction histidine kinase
VAEVVRMGPPDGSAGGGGGADVFQDGGEMGALCRSLDWAATPLGPVEGWPAELRTIVRTTLESPFPINLWCGPALVLIYNDAYRRVLGGKHPQALGRPGAEVWAEIWPAVGPMFERIRAGGPPVYAEDAPFVVARADGRAGELEDAWFTFSLSGVRDDTGAIVAYLNIVSETTRRLRAERAANAERAAAEAAQAQLAAQAEELRTATEELAAHGAAAEYERRRVEAVLGSISDAFFALDGAWRFTYVNDRAEQVLARRRGEILGRSLWEAFPEAVGTTFDHEYHRALEMRTPVVFEAFYPPLDTWFEVRAYPGAEGLSVYFQDVSERMRAEAERGRLLADAQRARAEAEEANRAKSQFLTTMSHELRTPLNAIGGYADLLLLGVRGALTEPQREDVERMRRSGQHLLALINDILNFAKLEAGQVEFHLQAVEIAALLDGLEDLIRPQVDAKGLRYIHGTCARQLVVRADPEKVRQVLINLLANAVKFTDAGGEVELSCEAAPAGGPVLVHVRDTGRGIAESQLRRVFDPFVQVDRHLTPTSQQGVGLGLAISRDLALGMGGELTARSEPGVGSTFTLTLPRSLPPTPD